MFRLGLGDNLIVSQTGDPENFQFPWSYEIIDIESDTVINSASGIVANQVIIALSHGSIFEPFNEKSLYLAIKNSNGNIIEEDIFLLSRLYERLPDLKTIAGLLGENFTRETESINEDYQDGHMLENKLTLEDTDEEFTWKKKFVAEFNPDKRFFINEVTQKESS